MPTYDYKCTRCGDKLAVEQSMLDKPLTRCRKCRGKLEKLLPRSLNLIFKGSGFYVTDYRKPDANGKKHAGEFTPKQPGENSSKKATEKKPDGGSTT